MITIVSTQYRLIQSDGNGGFAYTFKARYSPSGRMSSKSMIANNLVGNLRFGYDRKSFTHQPRTIYDPSEGTMECYWDAIGKPIQYIHYAPYGELIDNQRTIDYDERYKFTGKERDAESGYDYFGARYYASPFSFWLSVDPLADKYPAISPYAYCTWNPIKFIDPDGMRLRYGKGASIEFKQKFEKTINYMNSKNTSWIIAKIERSERIVYIEPTTEKSRCVTKGNIITIYWNPDFGVITNLGAILSPATVLNHEADHALQGLENPTQKRVDANTKVSNYDNLEEKRVITGSERITAYRHGEINKGEATRYDHKGQLYETTSPTSTMGVYEIIVDAPQNK